MGTGIMNPGDSVFRVQDLETGWWWQSRKGRHTFSTSAALKKALGYDWFVPEKYRIVEFKLVEVPEDE